MNADIDKLLDVDKEAVGILDAARKYREKTAAETEEAKKLLLEQINKKAARNMEAARRATEQEAQERIIEIREQGSALARELEETFMQKRQEWADRLFARCTERAVNDGD